MIDAVIVKSSFFSDLGLKIDRWPKSWLATRRKEHGNLLTILFCIGIVGSSVVAEFEPATIGVMSGILAIIILIKMIKGFKKYS